MRPTRYCRGKVAVIHAKLILIHKHNHLAKPVGMSTDLGEFHNAVLSSEQYSPLGTTGREPAKRIVHRHGTRLVAHRCCESLRRVRREENLPRIRRTRING